MKTRLPLVVVSVLGVSGGAHAKGLPDWLLGDWSVTKVYQLNDDLARYPDPGNEPVARWTGKIMTIEADRLHLGVDICTDLTVREKRDTVRHLVKHELGAEPEVFGGLTPRPGSLPYLRINCGRSLTEEEDGLDDRHVNYIDWVVIPNGHDKIDLMFLGPCYLELRRKEKPQS
jgi:hypothetical protein